MRLSFQWASRTGRILAVLLSIACGETFVYFAFEPPRPAATGERGALTLDQAREYMHQTGNLVVVDVRSRKEFSASHFPGALNLPLHSLPRLAETIPRDHPVLVYCLDIFRALQAYKILKKLRPDLSSIRHVASGRISLFLP